tara:strand:+ start:2346 stop:2834 length:489 start_codon:yes stop_codon:yes gene_type:complete
MGVAPSAPRPGKFGDCFAFEEIAVCVGTDGPNDGFCICFCGGAIESNLKERAVDEETGGGADLTDLVERAVFITWTGTVASASGEMARRLKLLPVWRPASTRRRLMLLLAPSCSLLLPLAPSCSSVVNTTKRGGYSSEGYTVNLAISNVSRIEHMSTVRRPK